MNECDEILVKIRKKFGTAWISKTDLVNAFLTHDQTAAGQLMSQIRISLPNLISVRMGGQLIAFNKELKVIPVAVSPPLEEEAVAVS